MTKDVAESSTDLVIPMRIWLIRHINVGDPCWIRPVESDAYWHTIHYKFTEMIKDPLKCLPSAISLSESTICAVSGAHKHVRNINALHRFCPIPINVPIPPFLQSSSSAIAQTHQR